jgi:DNA-binding beta-propeller fold protein YncE
MNWRNTMSQAAVIVLLLSLIGVSNASLGQPGASELLKLENTIPMADVQGRIDHLSIDLKGQRLFVAALGNNSLEVVDLKANKQVNSIHGLAEPQGIAYIPSSNLVFVANGKDGSVRAFDAVSWKNLKSISYGDDADNLRHDPSSGHIWVGYGGGALGEFDQEGTKLADIKLDAHPESFQLEKNGSRIFVNLPGSRKIAVVDRKTRTVVESWGTGGPLANFPMALDERDHRLFVVTRFPARLIVLDTSQGKRVATLPTIGDCDDVFYDERRHRIYAIGGEGGISVFQQRDADHYDELGRIKTVSGARTGFFSADLDRLYVAVRKHDSQSAEIRVYAPAP